MYPFVSVDKKMISLIINGILEMSWFVHFFSLKLAIVYALLRSYLDF